MKTPWINMKQAPAEQMSVFKSSDRKKNKKEVPKEPVMEETQEIEELFPAESVIESATVPEPESIIEPESTIEHESIIEPESTIEHESIIEPESVIEHKSIIEPAIEQEDETKKAEIVYPDEMTHEIQPHKQRKVYLMTKKIPFSVHVEIEDFLHEPICGDIAQHTFEFQDLSYQKAPEMDTKLLHTTTYYPEQPECRLVCSDIHEMIFLTNTQNERQHRGDHFKTIVVPLHDSYDIEAEESNGPYLYIRVPVVLGEYKIEVCLEETIAFKVEVMRINEISKEIILTNFKLVPTAFSSSLNNGTRNVLKGILWIEGYIDQKMKYTAFHEQNISSITPVTHLGQKIAAELIVHIQQVQKVRVKR